MSTALKAYSGGYKWCEIGYQDPSDDPAETASFTADAHALGEITSVNPTFANDPQEVRSGRRIEKVNVIHGRLEPVIDIEYFMASGRELFYVMGNQDTVNTVGGSDQYIHNLLLSNNIPYFSAETYGEEANSDRFLGCLAETWKMEATQGAIVKCNLTAPALNWDGGQTKPTTGELIPPDYTKISELYHFEHATFAIDDAASTTFDDLCHGFELEVSHAYERAPAFGKGYGAYATISERDTKLTITVDVQNASYAFRNLWSNQTTFTTTFTLSKTWGTYNHKVELTFDECKLLNYPKAYDATIRVPLDVEILSDWTADITDDTADYETLT